MFCFLSFYLSEISYSASFLTHLCLANMFWVSHIYQLLSKRSPRRVFRHNRSVAGLLFRRLISALVRPLQQMTLAFLTAANPKSPLSLLTGREANRPIVTCVYKYCHPNAESSVYLRLSVENSASVRLFVSTSGVCGEAGGSDSTTHFSQWHLSTRCANSFAPSVIWYTPWSKLVLLNSRSTGFLFSLCWSLPLSAYVKSLISAAGIAIRKNR